MNEAKVREIYKAEDLSGYTYEQLRSVDQWVKDYALARLAQHLKAAGVTKAMSEYVLLMTRCHYGTVETDEFLKVHQCYPEWLYSEAVGH